MPAMPGNGLQCQPRCMLLFYLCFLNIDTRDCDGVHSLKKAWHCRVDPPHSALGEAYLQSVLEADQGRPLLSTEHHRNSTLHTFPAASITNCQPEKAQLISAKSLHEAKTHIMWAICAHRTMLFVRWEAASLKDVCTAPRRPVLLRPATRGVRLSFSCSRPSCNAPLATSCSSASSL